MQFCKRFLAIILALVTVVCSQTIVASADEDPVKILFLGNSLVYYNEMDTKIFPELCAALGKNVVVESVVESGSSLYRLNNKNTKKETRKSGLLNDHIVVISRLRCDACYSFRKPCIHDEAS